MANLHRYNCRVQSKRLVYVDAQNASNAKDLAEQEIVDMEYADKIIVKNAVKTYDNTGTTGNGSIQLDGYDVEVSFRRNVLMDAEGHQEARQYVQDDEKSWDGYEQGSVQVQQISLMQENVGVTA